MSSVGAQILRKMPTPGDIAAGKKKVFKEGEANIHQVWPTELIQHVDKNVRSLKTDDILRNNTNVRQMKLQEQDMM